MILALKFITGNTYYDRHAALFDPSGRLLQLEYAKEAVERNGSPIMAIKANDGIILVISSLKRQSSLLATSSVQDCSRIQLTNDILVTGTGLKFDLQKILPVSAKIALQVQINTNEPISTERLSLEIATQLHRQILRAFRRPFGVEIIVAGHDEDEGYQIFHVGPGGSVNSWQAIAIGKNSAKINDQLSHMLQDVNLNAISCKDVLSLLKEKSSLVREFFLSNNNKAEDEAEDDNDSNYASGLQILCMKHDVNENCRKWFKIPIADHLVTVRRNNSATKLP